MSDEGNDPDTRKMKCKVFYQKYQNAIGLVFEKYGGIVSKYPWVIILICVLFNGLLGIGLINLKSNDDVESLYTPINNQASKDRATLKSLFTDFSGSNYYQYSAVDIGVYAVIMFKTKDGSNILNSVYLDEIQNIDSIIRNVTFVSSGTTYTHDDVCAIRNNRCVVEGDFIYTASFRTAVAAGNVSYPLFNRNRISGTFGNIVTSNNILTSATFARLVYRLRQDSYENYDLSSKWEQTFLTRVQAISSSWTDLAYEHSMSLSEELDQATGGDIAFFSATIALMLAYASLATVGGDCVSMRPMLAQAGVVATCLAVLGSIGMVSATGVEFVNIVGVMPFLIIGIGVDDMFILMSGMADEPFDLPLEQRIKGMLRHSGVAITITSLTDFLAFGIGASSVFLSVRNFCLYTGTAVLFCYINQLTFFVPCMVIHEQRIQSQRHAIVCIPVQPRQKSAQDGKTACYLRCCTGSPPTKREDIESPLEKYPKIAIQKIVQLKPMKVVILVLFAAYLGISIWGATNLEQGLLLHNLVKEDSYMYSYTRWVYDYFADEVMVSFTITSGVTYSSSQTQTLITNLLTAVKSDPDVNSEFEINWLSEYSKDALYDNSSETAFVTNLQTFLSSRSDLSNDVTFNTAGTVILASRFHIISTHLRTSILKGKFMERMRDIASTSGLSVFPFSPWFIFFEQYVAILPNTLQTLGIAVAVIFVITAIFMPHPLLIVLVTVTMVMIIVGIFAFMYFWGLSLSSITMIQVIMSVGFSVDFSAHICHAYISVSGKNRDARVQAALTRSGGPILNAAFSSFAGILFLLFSSSYIFQSFFKLMFLVILLGLLHAVFFLPVVLSLIGPSSAFLAQTDTSTNSQKTSMASVGPSKHLHEEIPNNTNEPKDKKADVKN